MGNCRSVKDEEPKLERTTTESRAEFSVVDSFLSIPFFEKMDHTNVKKLSSLFNRRVYEAEEPVILEGKRENSFHVIVRGSVRATAITPERKEPTVLRVYGMGDWFGDLVYVRDSITPVTITSIERSTILSIEGEEFQRVLKDNPDLSVSVSGINKSDSEPIVQLHKIPFFAGVPENKLQQLGVLLQFRRYKDGEIICKQGEEAESFFYMIEGRVDVSAEGDDGNPVYLDTLSGGNWFGEIALLHNTQRTATITVSKDCLVGVLTREHFNKFMELAPEIEESGIFQRYVSQRTANSLKAIPIFQLYRKKQVGPLPAI